ncbi:MAG: hypothetical protein M1318_06045 [Firmicutes bacterium]|nr:hypothetical protein [Bacillota bacterium]
MGRTSLIMEAHVPLTEYLAARGEHNIGGRGSECAFADLSVAIRGSALRRPFLEISLPVISSLGYLETLKGIEVLINAVRWVQDQSIPIKLLVMGDGPQGQQQEKLATSLGWVGGMAVPFPNFCCATIL